MMMEEFEYHSLLKQLNEEQRLMGANFLRCTKILSHVTIFLTYFFYHVKTHLWMIMMESKIVIV